MDGPTPPTPRRDSGKPSRAKGPTSRRPVPGRDSSESPRDEAPTSQTAPSPDALGPLDEFFVLTIDVDRGVTASSIEQAPSSPAEWQRFRQRVPVDTVVSWPSDSIAWWHQMLQYLYRMTWVHDRQPPKEGRTPVYRICFSVERSHSQMLRDLHQALSTLIRPLGGRLGAMDVEGVAMLLANFFNVSTSANRFFTAPYLYITWTAAAGSRLNVSDIHPHFNAAFCPTGGDTVCLQGLTVATVTRIVGSAPLQLIRNRQTRGGQGWLRIVSCSCNDPGGFELAALQLHLRDAIHEAETQPRIDRFRFSLEPPLLQAICNRYGLIVNKYNVELGREAHLAQKRLDGLYLELRRPDEFRRLTQKFGAQAPERLLWLEVCQVETEKAMRFWDFDEEEFGAPE